MDKIPFKYGKIVAGDNYTDRVDDVRHLYENFLALTNTTIISPRRWGKSSMVNRALEILRQSTEDYVILTMDAFNLNSREAFLEGYAKCVSTGFSKHKELKEFVSDTVPSVIPHEIVVSTGDIFPFELRINLTTGRKEKCFEDILNLTEKMAVRKGKKVVVCIDEFQVVADYEDSLAFQRTLRACWQRHEHVAYCLLGSKYNLMAELVGKPKMPLYKFGDVFFLGKIAAADWFEFVTKRFRDTGKEIASDAVSRLLELTECHSYYVQQLAQLTWFRTRDRAEVKDVEDAFAGLLDQLSMLFAQITEGLTLSQTEFLRGLCDGVTRWNAQETLGSYRVGSAANVKNIKNTLEKKEITTSFPDRIELQDPVYKYWLVHCFFRP